MDIKRIGIATIAITMLLVYFVSSHYIYDAFNKNLSNMDGRTLYVGGSGPNNYTSIQIAINHARPGDRIFIYDDSSPYHESLKIRKNNISLIGENRDTTIIKSRDEEAICVYGDNIKIYNLTIEGYGYDIFNKYGNNLFVLNCYLPSCSFFGSLNNSIISSTIKCIKVQASYNNIINCNISKLLLINGEYNNIINNTFTEGIEIEGKKKENWIHTIKNNTLQKKPIIYYKDKSDILIQHYDIGELILAGSHNISICDTKILTAIAGYCGNLNFCEVNSSSIKFYYSSNSFVDGACLKYIRLYGSENITIERLKNGSISLIDSHYNFIHNCDFIKAYIYEGKRNQFLKCKFGKKGIENAIELSHGLYNNFSYCSILDSNCGAYVSSSHIDFYRCNFSNNNVALDLDSGGHNRIIENNFFYNKGAIKIEETGNNIIRRNLFMKNGIGVSVEVFYDTGSNEINYNNFIKNEIHAKIYFLDKAILYNNWNRNYWDNWPAYMPKPILSQEYLFGTYFISWLNIDWHPLPPPQLITTI